MVCSEVIWVGRWCRVENGVVVRSTLRLSCEDVGFRDTQVLSHWENKYIHHIFLFICKMDAPSRNINAVPDQQPFTVLVTGANRQVAFLPNNSNDD